MRRDPDAHEPHVPDTARVPHLERDVRARDASLEVRERRLDIDAPCRDAVDREDRIARREPRCAAGEPTSRWMTFRPACGSGATLIPTPILVAAIRLRNDRYWLGFR